MVGIVKLYIPEFEGTVDESSPSSSLVLPLPGYHFDICMYIISKCATTIKVHEHNELLTQVAKRAQLRVYYIILLLYT